MSTDGPVAGKLPVRDFLKMGVSLLGMQETRWPEPRYRVIFRLSLLNDSGTSVRILGRKWTLKDAAGNIRIIEGEKVFNDSPVLTPGAVYSYGGTHEFTHRPLSIEVRFFGLDQGNRPFISPALEFPRRNQAAHA